MLAAKYLTLTLLLLSRLAAQDVTGNLGGTILDPAKAAVPGAKIAITNVERNQVVRTITSTAAGTYSVPLLPVGTYSIKVEAAGFKTATHEGIVLNVADNLTVDFALQLGSVTETVTVEATALTVDLTSPASTSVMESEQITELSLSSRNFAA